MTRGGLTTWLSGLSRSCGGAGCKGPSAALEHLANGLQEADVLFDACGVLAGADRSGAAGCFCLGIRFIKCAARVATWCRAGPRLPLYPIWPATSRLLAIWPRLRSDGGWRQVRNAGTRDTESTLTCHGSADMHMRRRIRGQKLPPHLSRKLFSPSGAAVVLMLAIPRCRSRTPSSRRKSNPSCLPLRSRLPWARQKMSPPPSLTLRLCHKSATIYGKRCERPM